MIGKDKLPKLGIIIFYFISFFYIGCQSGVENNETEEEIAVEDLAPSEAIDQKHYVLPSPFELAALIRKSGANYSKEILNPVEQVSNYIDNYKKAINLGVFGADLGYTLMYNQSQDGVNYLSNCKNLANELGIIGAFEASTIKSVERNLDNQDSLIRIAAITFGKSDMYLKEHERLYTSALIITGGWIEALYLASQVVETTSNEDIISRIGEQKISLDLLISQLKKFEGQEETAGELIQDLEVLQDIFKGVKITYDHKASTIDTSSKMLTINSTSTVDVSNETLNNIIGHITDVRSKIIE